MPAAITVKPSALISPAQHDAVSQAALTLPDGWTIIVAGDSDRAELVTVRIVGVSFAALSAFARLTRPEQLAAFAERVRREHG